MAQPRVVIGIDPAKPSADFTQCITPKQTIKMTIEEGVNFSLTLYPLDFELVAWIAHDSLGDICYGVMPRSEFVLPASQERIREAVAAYYAGNLEFMT